MADDHHEFDCYATSPAEDMVIARRAFEEGDIDHAVHHVACALSVDPRETHLRFLDGLLEAAPNPLELAPLEGETFFGTVAVRAHILHRLGRHLEAIDLLLQVIGVRPDVPYTEWLETWLNKEEVRETLSPDAFAVAVQRCLDQLDATELGGQCVPTVVPTLIDLVDQVRRSYPDHGPLALVHSRAARWIGDLDTALEVAREHYERVPGYLSAVTLAGAHRVRGDLDRALELFGEALDHNPDDLAVRLDMGDVQLERGDLGQAREAYEAVLDHEPDHLWALPSALYVQYRETGETAARDDLELLALSEEDNDRARELLEAITPFVGFLPRRDESVITFAHEALVHQAEGDVLRLELSSVEAPSAVAATTATLAAQGLRLDLSVTSVPTPDPRHPRKPVLYQLWRYEGIEPSPTLSPPSDEVAEALSDIAATPYNLELWLGQSHAAAESLGFIALESLLGAMVHPPPRPEGVPHWRWTFQIQIAAALTVAFVDDGWQDSVRRRALLSLLDGPVDWTSTAAVVALCALALCEEELRPTIIPILDEALTAPSTPIWRACVEEPLVHCMLAFPDLSSARREALVHHRARIESER